ncbi:MAG: DNA repair protein RecN [Saprospiraceae bacterium]|nr:DNA repair protein RecN [Saprospiraceae bacterium]
MLRSLRIENYAIIEKVSLDFDDTLNIITGETGAGKSIILGALGLVMGQRADTKVLYHDTSKCIVEATFNKYPKSIDAILSEADYDIEEELIIRREIAPSGKSRAFVNDTPTKLSFLQKITVDLIDLNSQFEITEIQNPKFHLNIIDALAGNASILLKYKSLYRDYKKKTKDLEELLSLENNLIKEMDFIKFQFNELDKVGLEEGELKKLESESSLLEGAEDIRILMEESKFLLAESDSNVKEVVEQLYYKWQSFENADPEIKSGLDCFNQILESFEELIAKAESIVGKAESNPKRLHEIQNRLDSIYSLQRKHNVQTVEELIAIYNEYAAKISSFDNSEVEKEKIKNDIEVLKDNLNKIGSSLTSSRKKVFSKLEKEVNNKLDDLSMLSSEIKVHHELSTTFKSDGLDEISILFKANKGGAFLPIKKVASGGESSRLMLSIKSTVAHVMQLPTMIFDEIDTGVSGDIAGKMGNILKELSNNHQVISITHSPQVASRAVKHFFVHKEDKKKRTVTHVSVLSDDERINEIAKMLSGNPPTTFALENAKELLDS